MLLRTLEKLTKEQLVSLHYNKLSSDSDDFCICQDMVRKVLTDEEINGPAATGHGIVDWVNILVKKVEELKDNK